jgi:energy-coupling factor transport system substrate-specific component
MAMRRIASGIQANSVVVVASLVGLVGFLYPFLLPAVSRTDDRGAHAADAPLLFALVTVFSLVAMAIELGERGSAGGSPAKIVALLGVLVATDATLRLAPSFLGASPIFFLIILAGAVFGPAFGFQMGALTMLVSAFLTGGLGPWLPYEMLGAGWVGLSAGWLPKDMPPRARLIMLAVFAAAWGLLYGALLNLYFWPYAAPGIDQPGNIYWNPSMGLTETAANYARFYLTTSLAYDAFRAAGNAVLMLALGGPTLRLLERFHSRFSWEPWTEMEPSALEGTPVAPHPSRL